MVALELHSGNLFSTRATVGRFPSFAVHGSKFPLSSSTLKPKTKRITQALTNARSCSSISLDRPRDALPVLQTRREESGGADREPLAPETLDGWMRDSVGEIVRNIGEAPFLVHIFSNKSSPSSSSSSIRLEREVASADGWPSIKRRWRQGTTCTPDGVILVEELNGDQKGGEYMRDDAPSTITACTNSTFSRSDVRTWGLVVQGRGMDGAACYLLSTTRVGSLAGFCTHFCLVKAKCFGDPAEVQLKKAWLQGG